MGTYKIKWDGKEYQAADITIFADTEDKLNITVASTELAEAIEDKPGAEMLENSIAFYLTPEEFSLSEEEIIKIVEENYC